MNDKQTIRAWLKVHRTQLPMYLLCDPAFMAEYRDHCRYERIRTFSIIAVVLTILILSYSGCEAVDHGDPQFSSRVIPHDCGADYTGAILAPGLAASAGISSSPTAKEVARSVAVTNGLHFGELTAAVRPI